MMALRKIELTYSTLLNIYYNLKFTNHKYLEHLIQIYFTFETVNLKAQISREQTLLSILVVFWEGTF